MLLSGFHDMYCLASLPNKCIITALCNKQPVSKLFSCLLFSKSSSSYDCKNDSVFNIMFMRAYSLSFSLMLNLSNSLSCFKLVSCVCHWSSYDLLMVWMQAVSVILSIINVLIFFSSLLLIPEVSTYFSYVRICLSITENAN